MGFLIEWLIFFIAILFAMSVDNIFWITSSAEWNTKAINDKGWKGPVKEYSLSKLIRYAIFYRVRAVITDWRDLIPAAITGFILSVIQFVW